MRLKLAHKLILINSSVIVILTSLFVGLSYYSSKSMFSSALNGIDREVIRSLAQTLGAEYDRAGTWQPWIEDQGRWRQVVDGNFFKVFFQLMAEVAEQRGQTFPPSPPGDMPPVADAQVHQSNSPPPNWEFPFGTFFQRLSLLDAQKKPLIAPEIFNQKATYQAVKFHGEIVGWLRVGNIDVDMLPLAQYFFEQQLQIVYWSCLAGALVAVLLSFFLSRHITAPIKELTEKSAQIARRDFSSPVTIKTGDELEELARGFNGISEELSLYQQRQKQWLMNVSHELKAPLTVLVGEVFAICDNLSRCDETTAELLQKEAMRIKRIADDLYQLCQIDEMGIQLHCAPIRLSGVLQDLLARYEARFQKRGLIVHAIYPTTEIDVLADPDRIAQLVGNLFENCLRYSTSPGSLWLTEEMTDTEVLIALEDSGPGVPDEALPKLFDRLYRVESGKGNPDAGVGLGLAICREIANAHGGTLVACRGSSGGLRIELRLPAFEYKLVGGGGT